MTDTIPPIEKEKQQKKTKKRNITRHPNRLLQEKGLKMMNREHRNIRDNDLRTIGEAVGEGSEKRRRVKPGESKMEGFSMGGMADYIKDLL